MWKLTMGTGQTALARDVEDIQNLIGHMTLEQLDSLEVRAHDERED